MEYFKNTVLEPLLKQAPVRTYVKGQIIMHADDRLLDVFVTQSGAVTMQDTDHGAQKILYIFGPNTLFPMTSFAEEEVSVNWSYAALTKVEVWVLSYAEVRRHLEGQEQLAYNLFLQQLLNEVHELLVRLSNMTKTDSRQKLIATLKFLGKCHTGASRRQWQRVTFPVTHQLLADMTGLTRETVTVVMKQLQEEGLVRAPALATLELNVTKLSTTKV